MRTLALVVVLAACGPPDRLRREPCRDPDLWEPTSDTADPDAVYFGCHPPEGWVRVQDDTGSEQSR